MDRDGLRSRRVLPLRKKPNEMERADMRLTGDEIPQHRAEHIRDVVLKRLYQWLQAGANPQDGC